MADIPGLKAEWKALLTEMNALYEAWEAAKERVRARGEYALRDPEVRELGERLMDSQKRGSEAYMRMSEARSPGSSERFAKRLALARKMAPKALATGVAAKLMLGGVAKAAGAPGVTEAMEIAGREQHTPTEFIRSEADSIAEMLGLATGYQGREPRYDARREAAIRATMRSGREGLRPAPGETPITPEEVEAYQRRRR